MSSNKNNKKIDKKPGSKSPDSEDARASDRGCDVGVTDLQQYLAPRMILPRHRLDFWSAPDEGFAVAREAQIELRELHRALAAEIKALGERLKPHQRPTPGEVLAAANMADRELAARGFLPRDVPETAAQVCIGAANGSKCMLSGMVNIILLVSTELDWRFVSINRRHAEPHYPGCILHIAEEFTPYKTGASR